MKRSYGVHLLLIVFLSLAFAGCSDDAGNLTSPVLDSAEELGNAVTLEGEGFDATGEGFYASGLIAAEVHSVGEYTLRFYTPGPMNTSVLLEDVDENDDSTAIQEKINSKREQLYPDGELALEISGGSETGAMLRAESAEAREVIPKSAARARLVKRLILWNRVHRRNGYIWARYRSSTAVLFVNVMRGRYGLYRASGYRWVRLGYTSSVATAHSVGGYTLRGFKVLGVYSSNKIDYVAYFFR